MKTQTTRSIVASTAILHIGITEAFVGRGVLLYSTSHRPIAFQRQRLPNSNTLFAIVPDSDTGSSFFKGNSNSDASQKNPRKRKRKREDTAEQVVEEDLNIEENKQGIVEPVVDFMPQFLRAIEVAAEKTVEKYAEIKVELPAELDIGIDECVGAGPIERVPSLSNEVRQMYENEVATSHAEENERLRLETEQLNAAGLRAENETRLQIRENERVCIEAEGEAARSRVEEIERQRIEGEQQGGNENKIEQQEAARSQAKEVEHQRFEAERRIVRLAAERKLGRLETVQLAAKLKTDEDRQRLLGEYEEIAKREAKEKDVIRVVESNQVSVMKVKYPQLVKIVLAVLFFVSVSRYIIPVIPMTIRKHFIRCFFELCINIIARSTKFWHRLNQLAIIRV